MLVSLFLQMKGTDNMFLGTNLSSMILITVWHDNCKTILSYNLSVIQEPDYQIISLIVSFIGLCTWSIYHLLQPVKIKDINLTKMCLVRRSLADMTQLDMMQLDSNVVTITVGVRKDISFFLFHENFRHFLGNISV